MKMGHIKDHKTLLYDLKEDIESAADYDLLRSELVYYEIGEHPREEAGEMDIVGVNLYLEGDQAYRIMDVFEVKSSDSIYCQIYSKEQMSRVKKYFTEVYDDNLFDEVNTFIKICDREVHNLESDIDVPPKYLDKYRAAKSELNKNLILNHGEEKNERKS